MFGNAKHISKIMGVVFKKGNEMKIKTLVKWLEGWDGSLELDDFEFTDSLRDELGLKIVDLESEVYDDCDYEE